MGGVMKHAQRMQRQTTSKHGLPQKSLVSLSIVVREIVLVRTLRVSACAHANVCAVFCHNDAGCDYDYGECHGDDHGDGDVGGGLHATIVLVIDGTHLCNCNAKSYSAFSLWNTGIAWICAASKWYSE